jgi:hypothetical protein
MRISQAAFDLIVAEEVTSQAVYSKKYRKPEWPGESSGVTVGIGYDLGQTAAATIRADWKDRVPPAMLDAMVSASGVTGARAKTLTARLRDKIDIPWATALAVHEDRVLPRWEAKVAKALPNTDKLSPDCFGALVSLTFNRGPSFSTKGDRYIEMRAIKAHMAAGNYAAIPNEFRSMKRIWPKTQSLRERRDTEAKLFERGLSGEKPAPIKQTAPPADPNVKGDPEVWHVQRRLKAMNYLPGDLDGLWGGITGGAITGFINDRHLNINAPTSDEMFHKILNPLKDEISKAEGETPPFTRPIAPERAEATPAELAPKLPEVKAAVTAERLGFWGSVCAAATTAITGISKFFGDAVEWLNPLKTLVADLPWPVWVGGAFILSAALYYVSRKSGDAKNAATQAYNEGARV